MRCAVVLTCHNRRDLTLRAVRLASEAAANSAIELSFSIYDDGSSDGTAAAIRDLQLDVEIIKGDGNAYWARGMAHAERQALNSEPCPDYILWLNDDVALDSFAFEVLFATARDHENSVVVGATRDPVTGHTTYSGLMRKGIHPLSFSPLEPNDRAQFVETFNGNVVLVPRNIAEYLGGIDGAFPHGFADIDYGLRCLRQGVPTYLAPRYVGECARNPEIKQPSIRAAWLDFTGIKGGGNYSSLRLLLQKKYPRAWPFIVFGTYALWWERHLLAQLNEASRRR